MKTTIKIVLFLALILTIAIVAARLSFPPPDYSGPATKALPASDETYIGRAVNRLAASYPGQSGIMLLADGNDAFVARHGLIDAAEKSIDIRMYIWRRDMTGLILMQAILNAANRGVKVRLLVDDNGVVDFDPEFAAFNLHPNVEVRIFNPFVLRRPRFLNYAFDFFRLNRRMHNKSITIDGVTTIFGGRNIGNEYFSVGQGIFFIDLDLIGIGNIVGEVTEDFDRYWASDSAIPASEVIDANQASFDDLEREAAVATASRELDSYQRMPADADIVHQMLNGDLEIYWARTKLYSDDPAKGKGRVADEKLMITGIENDIGVPQSAVNLVSPYYIPGKDGVEILSRWARNGVGINVLTNSFLATDVVPVHSGYTKYRGRLLRAGIRLFELKPDSSTENMHREFRLAGSSGSSLHAKTFSVDGRRLFVGSYNFDPRSELLNCEMGVLIESPELAAKLDQFFVERIPEAAYHVTLRDDGGLQWNDGADGVQLLEPGTTLVSRMFFTILGWLPIEWLL